MRRRFAVIFFCVEFVVRIWIQPAKPVFPRIVRVRASNHVRSRVLEENHAFRDEVIGLIQHHSVHGAELRFAFGVLRDGSYGHKRQDHRQPHESYRSFHFFSPSGSIRNTIRASPRPVLASSIRVWSANPFMCTTISYCEPCGTRIANSPREFVESSQRNLFSVLLRILNCTPGNAYPFGSKTVPMTRKSFA